MGVPWFDHPSYRPLRDALIERFRQKAIAFQKLKHIVFLCGAADSTARPALEQYLRAWAPDTTLVFRADDVWARLASTPGLNALEMEGRLAELADAVGVIVESPGTFAELGAFANSEPLRKKLLPILDARYAGDKSFINTGPVQRVNADSHFAPAVVVDLTVILAAVEEITERLQRLPSPARARIDDFLHHRKHLLFLLRDIVAVAGPISADHAAKYVAAIATSDLVASVPSLLGLGECLQLVAVVELDGRKYFHVPAGTRLRPFVRKKYFNLNEERAKMLGALMTIPSYRRVLTAVREA
jgi:hypothetical protein